LGKAPSISQFEGGKGQNASWRVAVGREHCPTRVLSEGGVVAEQGWVQGQWVPSRTLFVIVMGKDVTENLVENQ